MSAGRTEEVGSTLDPLFRPRSIAVIGASRSPGTIGYEIVDNLVRHGYQGAVYPVNPKASFLHSLPAWPSVSAIPADIDLAMVVVPKEQVLKVMDECGARGVPAVVVITAGFREIGGAGAERERALVQRQRRYGMRLVGPNCLGILTTDPAVSMNATFAPTMPPPGPVSLISQSGAMGVTILDYAAEYGIGIRHFVSVGNKADVSGNDLLEYWEADEGTGVILMYLESFGNPRKFTSIARRVTKRKPVIVVKAGRTVAGVRAASSHTGALAGLDAATDALLAQCGVIRVDSVEALFDLAMAFGHLPLPAGNRVAIVTNAGGPGIIIADACESAGLAVAPLSEVTQDRLREELPEEACVGNPVDMIATATAASYRTALEHVLRDPNIDAAIAAFVPPLGVKQRDVARAIVEVRGRLPEKPVLAVLMGREGLPQGRSELQSAGVPAYIFPESAARALAAMYRQKQWLDRPAGRVRRFDVDAGSVAEILDRAKGDSRDQLSGEESRRVLSAYGIPTMESRLARSAEQAVAAARVVGLPVALKVVSPDVVHKTDVQGVLLDLRTEQEVERGYGDLVDRVREAAPGAAIEGVSVERFVRGGRETIVGMSADPSFGPVLMFGLGGVYVEALQDVVFRVHPVSDLDAAEMIRSIRGFRLLEGFRGEPPADLAVLTETIQRVSQLVGDHPGLLELEMNPFAVFERGGLALDARIRIGRAGDARTGREARVEEGRERRLHPRHDRGRGGPDHQHSRTRRRTP